MSVRSDITVDMGFFGGDDKVIDHYIVTGPEIRLTAPAALGATTLTVQPLKEAIADTSKLRFGMIPGETAGLVVTLSAAAAYGATSISVTAISGSLAQAAKGAKCQNVTGWTLAMSIYTDPEKPAVHTETPAITTATEGAIRTTITDTESGTTLTPGTVYTYRLRRTDNDFEDTLAFGALALRV